MIPLLYNDNACKSEIKLKVEKKKQMKRSKIMWQNRKDESLTWDLQKTTRKKKSSMRGEKEQVK